MEKKKVNIRIQGKDYVIVSSDTEEYVRSVAFLVEKKLSEVSVVAPQLSTAMSAVLVSLNIADDFLKSEKSCDNLRQQVADYLEEIANANSELDLLKAENSELAEKVRQFEISMARRDTEITELRSRKSYE